MTAPRDTLSVEGVRISAALVEAAMTVRASAPELLSLLANAAARQAEAAAQSLVHADIAAVKTSQGRAQAFNALAALLAQPEAYFKQYPKR